MDKEIGTSEHVMNYYSSVKIVRFFFGAEDKLGAEEKAANHGYSGLMSAVYAKRQSLFAHRKSNLDLLRSSLEKRINHV